MQRKIYDIADYEIKKQLAEKDKTLQKYVLYDAPSKPTEHGKYYASTPILEQALQAIEKANEAGKILILKVVCTDGTELDVL